MLLRRSEESKTMGMISEDHQAGDQEETVGVEMTTTIHCKNQK